MKTVQEILQTIVWKDTQEQGNGLGTLKEVFPNAEILIVKVSRNNAKRATLMLREGNKVTNVICAEKLTPLVRDGRVTKEHLAGFPLVYNEAQNSIYIGFPAEGWTEIRKITVAKWEATAVSKDDLIV